MGELTLIKKDIRFTNNLLTGTLPTEVGRLTALEDKFDLDGQGRGYDEPGISGTFPTEVGMLTAMTEFAFKVKLDVAFMLLSALL